MQLQLLLILAQNTQNSVPYFMLIIGVFFIMYFFMIRPQQKRVEEQKSFLEDLKKGDRIVTIGGIHGKINRVGQDALWIEVDTGTRLKIERSVISVEFSKTLSQNKKSSSSKTTKSKRKTSKTSKANTKENEATEE